MSTQATKTPPVAHEREGRLKAAIWQQHGSNGVFYNVTIERTYEDEAGNLRSSDSLSKNDLYRLPRLVDKAISRISIIEQSDRAEAKEQRTG